MLYDISKIQQEFLDRNVVLFKDDLNVNNSILPDRLKGISRTGLYFNSDTHQYLLNLQNIFNHLEISNDEKFSTYAAGTTYEKGVWVTDGTDFFRSTKADNLGNALTSSFWKKTPLVFFTQIFILGPNYLEGAIVYDGQDYYEALRDNNQSLNTVASWEKTSIEGIVLKNTVNDAIERTLANTVKASPLIDNQQLYGLPEPGSDTIENTGKLVGTRYWNNRCSEHLNIKINRIGLMFDGVVAALPIKIFRQDEEIFSFNLAYTTPNRFVWLDLPIDVELNGVGPFYIVYDQADLGAVKAIGKDVLVRNRLKEYMDIISVRFDNVAALVDYSNVDRIYDQTFGINMDITVSVDLTEFLLKHLNEISEVVKFQWGFDMLEKMLYNPEVRVGRVKRNIDEQKLMFELRGEEGFPYWKRLAGKKKKLLNAFRTISSHDYGFEEIEVNAYEIR